MNARVDRLPVVVIYPHTRCNCRCAMCDIWKRTSGESIEPDRFARYLEDFAGLNVEWVVFSGGEPLMHPQLDVLCSMAKARGLHVTILTTGLLLERNAEWIAGTVDDVIVSLDGPPEVHDRIRGIPGAFARIARGVSALRARRAGFPVSARCTVQKENCRLLRATTLAAEALGLTSVSFLAADLSSGAFDHSAAEVDVLRMRLGLDEQDLIALNAEVDALISAGLAGNFVREPAEKLRRIVHQFYAQLGVCHPTAPRCNAPWVSAVIETDGTIRPCFFHRPFSAQDSESLREILNGPDALAFRSGLDVEGDETCRRCVCSLYVERGATNAP